MAKTLHMKLSIIIPCYAEGDVVVVQDADLEYDPLFLPQMLKLIEDDMADVVFGSRFLDGTPHRLLYFWHYIGNKLLPLLSNMFTDINLSDMETC
jgi:glycosyltransferase involved in cell wall biosynthesis